MPSFWHVGRTVGALWGRGGGRGALLSPVWASPHQSKYHAVLSLTSSICSAEIVLPSGPWSACQAGCGLHACAELWLAVCIMRQGNWSVWSWESRQLLCPTV